ncbi:lysosomal Pro-X carboxypeptidase-like isoform X2 [Ostrea edulis]|uniref:lysosomal Pro-X carboxypeptidase-like isoform X2 n=1 Tax=Ostrea edulis TaxID=37623 RepID=UPI0024AEEEEF|nr:lysosomal Pro-X carboxypeptidase-like isoform X2 [Ostrea edulis]
MAAHRNLFSIVVLSLCLCFAHCILVRTKNFQRNKEVFRFYRPPSEYNYKTEYFAQKVDHFGFHNKDSYQQRYLIADQFWDPNGGPIFFYTGNEGDITLFCNNTGFMWDIAPEFKALLIFAEHRYYGTSVPYGPTAFKDPTKMNYLTSEQALADYAVLIKHIKTTTPGAGSSKVIAFGGSYGGMLAAWFRMKYPNVVQGSLAASAPIWTFLEDANCDAFDYTVTETFRKSSPDCVNNIKALWKTLGTTASQAGLSKLSEMFHLCKPLKTMDDLDALKGWIQSALVYLTMVDYPYPSSFLAPLPAWPVKAACRPLSTPLSGDNLIMGAVKAMNVYFNYTGTTPCFDIGTEATPDLGIRGWGYQSCTEMVAPSCSNGKTDMFEKSDWNFKSYSEGCLETWKVKPDIDWLETQYWGKNLSSASNIIFSNGLLDPWSSGGVLKTQSDSVVAVVIPNGAHHLDLRGANKKDTPDVISARELEKKYITKWLN